MPPDDRGTPPDTRVLIEEARVSDIIDQATVAAAVQGYLCAGCGRSITEHVTLHSVPTSAIIDGQRHLWGVAILLACDQCHNQGIDWASQFVDVLTDHLLDAGLIVARNSQ